MQTEQKVAAPAAREYLTAVEIARLIRKDLKATFPGIRFSVVSDGNSVRIRWTDGPDVEYVQRIGDVYVCGSFDGMTDSFQHKPDHRIMVDGVAYRSHLMYAFTERSYSVEVEAEAFLKYEGRYGKPVNMHDVMEARDWRKIRAEVAVEKMRAAQA